MPTPTIALPTSNTSVDCATAIHTAPTVNTREDKINTVLRPKK